MRCHPPERARDYLDRGWWSGETVDGLLRARVAEAPGRQAFADPPDTASLIGRDPVRWTWRELDEQVDALAADLLARGVRAGEVVAVQLPNSSALVQAFLAIVRIGAIVMPFPVAYREHELIPMCRRAGAVCLLTTTGHGEHRLAAQALRVGAEVPSVRFVLSRGQHEPDGTVRWPDEPIGPAGRELLDAHLAAHPADVSDCVTICWTSGTETDPKAVPRCHGDWLVMALGTCHAAALGPEDVLLSPFPMTNMAGISGMFLPWLMVGGVFVPHQPFDLGIFLGQIAQESATYTVAPPALLNMLLRNEEILSTVDLSSLRTIGCGSSPLNTPMVRGWHERYGIDVINFFGSNEGIALLSDPRDIPDPGQRATYFPNFSGPAVWSTPIAERVSVRLHDLSTGERITAPGIPGELRVAGPTVFGGYLGEGTGAPLDRAVFDDDGHYRTGDVFAIDGEDGRFLRYLDRAKDLIIRGGANISPAELEDLLAAHSGVAEVAVVGVADAVLGERVCAVVVPADPADPPGLDTLLGALRERGLASFKLPERLELVDSLPRNAVGKVLKRELRDRFAAPVPLGR
ncbi:2,3-dihydroxybenzoate-AMP ligase [Amycolatopsis antarctica]|uniref:2,3-dihydroxybenzoate-AMP ligase n=1 Tax=Amycolatopsis antarctica TaxID=1854586 RepID=A0A263CVH2_9PSEU|nr:class I adenylate-forming enzyme family protein [Amycolatopsis antarctica]OZM70130.1 2,3-dihydroxybenzoate-AMP ligase [Amycolatopsis antarctica]